MTRPTDGAQPALSHCQRIPSTFSTNLRRRSERTAADAHGPLLSVRPLPFAGNDLPQLRQEQRYCGHDCARAARRESLREAGPRYQRSRRGRLAHATRARRYRARHNNVTHHSPPACHVGSLLRRPADDVVVAPTDVGERATTSIMPMPSCRFCRCRLSLFLRTGFVRRRGPRHAHPYGGRDPTDDRYP